jgi:hypothetical protein
MCDDTLSVRDDTCRQGSEMRCDIVWQSAIKLVFVQNTLQLLLQDGFSAYMDGCTT